MVNMCAIVSGCVMHARTLVAIWYTPGIAITVKVRTGCTMHFDMQHLLVNNDAHRVKGHAMCMQVIPVIHACGRCQSLIDIAWLSVWGAIAVINSRMINWECEVLTTVGCNGFCHH